MTIVIQRWERKPDFTPDYFKPRQITNVHGENATECMSKIHELRDNNDLNKYTPFEIIGVYD